MGGFLDDYAFTLDACLELLQSRWSDETLAFAQAIGAVIEAHFQDVEHGGLLFTPDDHEALIQRPLALMDDALPSGNGGAIRALYRLGHLTGDAAHDVAAKRALAAAEGSIVRAPEAHCALLIAHDEVHKGLEQVVCCGPEAGALRETALRYFVPFRAVYHLPPGNRPPAGVRPATADDEQTGQAWLCAAGQCLPPVSDPTALAEQLATARRST